jgi:hypothetical protein
MSRQQAIVLLLFLLSALSVFPKTKDKEYPEGWLPITQQDFSVKEVPNDLGADAVQLYMSYYKDDDAKFISVYKRIRILRESGRKRADVEIPIEPGQSLEELTARTIHPDQKIVDFTGKPFEKVISKRRSIKFLAQAFSLPDVTIGSIIEYRYVIALPPGVVNPISAWPIQGDLFTLKENLRFRAYQGLVTVPSEWRSAIPRSQVSYSYLNQIDPNVPERKQGNLMELELQNVPKFDAEEYMPPEDDFRPVLLFYYGGREMSSPDRFWDEWWKSTTEYVDKFIGSSREIHAAAQSMAGETDPEKKLRRLYIRAQQIRNLTFERERTDQEKKEEHLKRNSSAQEVLQRGYGTSWDVNATFAAMARAAGFEANLLGVSDRKERTFNKVILWSGQLDASAVMVSFAGKDFILDPGTRFCPFGLLRSRNSGVSALKYGNANGGFVITPEAQSSVLRRMAHVTLDRDGNLSGEISVEFKGEDALEHRLDALNQDDAGRSKSLEDEVKGWFPQAAVVKLQDSRGWDSINDPLVARFKVEVSGFASVTGKRVLLPAFFSSTLQKNMFTSQFRRYPITFPFPFTEDDELTVELPAGYAVEEPPYRRKIDLAYARYKISSEVKDHKLITARELDFKGTELPPEKYEELKNFFSVVRKGDEDHAVLRRDE